MNIGDRVTVTDGPYAGQSGTLTDLAGIRAGVLIDSLGKRRSILREDFIAVPLTVDEIDAQIDAHFAACDQQHPEDCATCADLFTARADAHGEPATYTEAGGDQTPVTLRGWADAAGRILDDRLPAEERRQSATYALIQRTPEAQAQLVEAARITA